MKKLASAFRLSREERQGARILMVFLLAFLLIKFYTEKYFDSEPFDYSPYQAVLDSLALETEMVKSDVESEKPCFPFDPNLAGLKVWMNLGFSEKASRGILKYREYYGPFESKSDLLNLYAIDSSKFVKLLPCIELSKPEKLNQEQSDEELFSKRNKSVTHAPEKKIIQTLDFNSADSLAFETLPGIGSKTASRLVRFREKLGGFNSIQQIRNMWGMNDENFSRFQEYIVIDTSLVNPICVNSADVTTLSQHPYIRNSLAKALVNFRDQHGFYRSVQDIRKCVLVNDSIYVRIRPYLSICPG